MSNNLLPIGTIIKLNNNDNKYVILGTFCKNKGKMFTYYCCLYPYGLILDDDQLKNKVNNYDVYINHDEIEKVLFLGNVNSEV